MDQQLDRPDATLAYSITGPADADRTLVAAHSLATSRQWEDEFAMLAWSDITASGERVTRFDTRGHGTSTAAPGSEHFIWPALAEDFLAIADAVSPGQPVDGLGQSTGCGVLLWAAATRPDRFRRLVLLIPPTHGEARQEQAQLYLAAAEMVELRGTAAWQRALRIAPTAPILEAGGWDRPNWIAVQDGLIPSVLRGAAASVLPDEDLLRHILQPTLILTWDADPSHPVDAAQYLADHIATSSLEVTAEPDEVRRWGQRIASFLR